MGLPVRPPENYLRKHLRFFSGKFNSVALFVKWLNWNVFFLIYNVCVFGWVKWKVQQMKALSCLKRLLRGEKNVDYSIYNFLPW